MRPYVAPLSSPKPPRPPETITGVHKAVRRQIRFWAGIVGGTLTLLGGGGGAALHFTGRQHTDQKVDERTAVLETQQVELTRRVGELERKVDTIDDHQVAGEQAAQQRQVELLEAIKGKRR